MKIYLISQDAVMAENLDCALAEAGHCLSVQTDPAGGSLARDIDLCLLIYDLGEGTPDSWKWLSQWLRIGCLPLIVLGPFSRNMSDPVRALRMGADDYVPRPICLQELVLRAETVTRRVHDSSGTDALFPDGGDVELDPEASCAFVAGRQVNLTPTEFKLLEKLACQEGQPVKRQALASHVWGSADAVTDTSLSLYIWNLRQKLEADPSRPRLIVTRRGLGYVFQGRLGRQPAS